MQWTIPGTLLQIPRQDAQNIDQVLSNLFLAGGITLSQLCAITGVEAHTVQNWVKRGFLPAPKQKHYDVDQLCRVIHIQILKGVMPMDEVTTLLGYVNGRLDDRSDDIIPDSRLYGMFVRLMASPGQLFSPQEQEHALQTVMDSYDAPTPGAAMRVEKALRILLAAWLSARMRQEAEKLLQQFKIQEGEMEYGN